MTDLFPLVGAVAAMLAVLLPVVLLQGKGLRREMDHLRTAMDHQVASVHAEVASLRTHVAAEMASLRTDVAAEIAGLRTHVAAEIAGVRAEVADLRRDLNARIDTLTTRVESLSERVARVEGALAGPWRPPANGNPAPAPSSVAAAT